MTAQRRPGREPRRHRAGTRASRSATPALNEGRGANPGDTSGSRRRSTGSSTAQRRPGREPRRHFVVQEGDQIVGVAQRRPGREPRRHAVACSSRQTSVHAQRRPGREPRRHMVDRAGVPGAVVRSTKAGARTPATPAGPGLGTAGRSRSTKAGARTPATRRRRTPAAPTPRTLNEGRGANPGDTWRARPIPPPCCVAQRRPGREPRRHLDHARTGARDQDRSTKAGARTPATRAVRKVVLDRDGAQRRPGREPRRHPAGRSAGESRVCGAQRRPGREPRRHAAVERARPRPKTAQRRPGREPRRHAPGTSGTRAVSVTAQRRPGREPRRHCLVACARFVRLIRSTKAGARTPATLPPGA